MHERHSLCGEAKTRAPELDAPEGSSELILTCLDLILHFRGGLWLTGRECTGKTDIDIQFACGDMFLAGNK